MTALITILGTILAAVVTAAVGIRSYRSQKDTDRQVELRKQQRAAYEAYLQSYYDWTYTEDGSDEDEKAKDVYRQAYFKLFPLASDSFLRAAMTFHTYVWEEPYPDFAKEADREKFEKLWASLVVEMRKDANVESQLIQKEIEDHIPWYWPSYVSRQEPPIEQNMEERSDRFTSVEEREVEEDARREEIDVEDDTTRRDT